MSGLVGFFAIRPEQGWERSLERMAQAVCHSPQHRIERFTASADGFAIAQVSLHAPPAGPSPHRWLCGEAGEGFVQAEYDPARNRLTIVNDRFGMMPLFYAQVDQGLLFATELKALFAHPGLKRRIDPLGLADLMAFGFILGERTLAAGVRCLPGGARLGFDGHSGRLEVERTWDFREQVGRGDRQDAEALEQINECFRRAVEARCVGGQVGVSLSGGYDSRTIMAAIDHRRHRIETLTLDVPGGADQVIGERIARHTNGLRHHHFSENGTGFFERWPEYVREMVWLTDGMYYDEACVMMPTLDLYPERGIDVVLRGHGGELARMQWAYELRCNRPVRACRTQAALIRQLFQEMRLGIAPEDLDAILSPEWAAALRGAAEASLEAAFAGVDPAWDVIDQVSCVFVQEYLRRQAVPSLAMLRSRVGVRMPYLDNDYVAAVLQLPPQGRLGTRVHRHLLRRNHPALARITNANTGAPAGAGDLTQRLCAKTNSLLRQRFGYERFRHYVDVPGWLRGPLRGYVERVLLERRTLERGIYQPSGVRGMLETHMSGRADCGETLLLLLYFELWNRFFVDGEPWNDEPGSRGESPRASYAAGLAGVPAA